MTRDHIKLAHQIWAEIAKRDRILLHMHPQPDLDSAGSALAMKLVLERLGKHPTVIQGDNPPPINARHLAGINEVKPLSFDQVDFKEFDLFISLDSSHLTQITRRKELKTPLPIFTIVIDHHKTNIGYGDLNLITTEVSSTCELVYWLLKQNEFNFIDKDIAGCLYAGIWADTGSFKFKGTQSSSYRAAAELIDTGVDFSLLINRFLSVPSKYIKCMGNRLGNLKEYFGGRVAITTISVKDLEACGLNASDMANMYKNVTFILSDSSDATITAVIYERPGLGISASVRSDNLESTLDVSVIASKFGGGGHAMASGTPLPGPTLNEAVEQFLNGLQETYPELGRL